MATLPKLPISPGFGGFALDPGQGQIGQGATGITALAGGGLLPATPQLAALINRVTTSTTGGFDSVVLPSSLPGMIITVINASGFGIQIYPAVGDNINVLGANTSIALAVAKTMAFFCANAGQWHTILTA
jgi:hypothetical protein